MAFLAFKSVPNSIGIYCVSIIISTIHFHAKVESNKFVKLFENGFILLAWPKLKDYFVGNRGFGEAIICLIQ